MQLWWANFTEGVILVPNKADNMSKLSQDRPCIGFASYIILYSWLQQGHLSDFKHIVVFKDVLGVYLNCVNQNQHS